MYLRSTVFANKIEITAISLQRFATGLLRIAVAGSRPRKRKRPILRSQNRVTSGRGDCDHIHGQSRERSLSSAQRSSVMVSVVVDDFDVGIAVPRRRSAGAAP